MNFVAYTTYHRYFVSWLFLHWQRFCRMHHASENGLTTNRKKRSTNTSHVLLKELQATIAFACFDALFLIQCGISLSEAAIEDVMTSIYYGDDKNGAPDSHMITYMEQYMLGGMNKFKGLYRKSMQTGSGELLLCISELLHRHKIFSVYVAWWHINRKGNFVAKTVALIGQKVSGQTLVWMSKAETIARKRRLLWNQKVHHIEMASSLLE